MNNENDNGEFEKAIKDGMKMVVLVWCFGLIIGTTLLCGVVYVTIHFLGKVW